jgi:hypothetical protein
MGFLMGEDSSRKPQHCPEGPPSPHGTMSDHHGADGTRLCTLLLIFFTPRTPLLTGSETAASSWASDGDLGGWGLG